MLPQWLSAQQAALELLVKHEIKNVQGFAVDQFENIFLVKNESLVKWNDEFKEQAAYSNPINGTITHIDVVNALNPYVFYSEVNQIEVLDRMLNLSQSVNLFEWDLLDVPLISFSDQEHVWAYNQSANKLQRVNLQSGQVSNQSVNLASLQEEAVPVQLLSTVDHVFLLVPSSGIWHFDALGALVEQIQLPDVQYFTVRGNSLYYLQQNNVFRYDLKLAKNELLLKAGQQTVQLKVVGKKLYLLTLNQLQVYRIL